MYNRYLHIEVYMEENKVLSGVIQEIVSLNDNTLVIEKVVNYALAISRADCAVFFRW